MTAVTPTASPSSNGVAKTERIKVKFHPDGAILVIGLEEWIVPRAVCADLAEAFAAFANNTNGV